MRSRMVLVGFLLAGVLVGLCLLTSCGGKSGNVVAKVGSIEITVADYNRQYLAITAPRRPKEMNTLEGKKSFLNDIINKEILAHEAVRRGYAEDPSIVQTMKILTDQEILDAVRDEAIERQIKFEPGEIREYYEKQGEEYHVHLLVFQDRAMAEKAVEGIRGGAAVKDFVAGSSLPNSDMGWHAWGEFEEPLNTEVFNLTAGQVTDAISMEGDDLVVAKVTEVRPKDGLGTFEEMRSSMKDRLTQIKRRSLFGRWTLESMETHNVQPDNEVIAKILDRLIWDVDAAGQEIRPGFTPEEENWVLGTYSGGQFTVGAFIDELMLMSRTARPNPAMGASEFGRLMQMVLMNKAILEDAYTRDVQKRPEIAEELDRAREERIVTMLYQGIIKDVTITSHDIETYYENYQDSLRKPEQYEVSRIVVRTEEGANVALKQIRSGTAFEDVARARSTGRFAQNGGKLSPVTADVFPPAVREVVVSLKTGEIGGPLYTDDGWILIRLDAHTLERQLSLEETQETIRMQMLQSRQGEVFDAWLQEKRQEMGVEIFNEVLAGVELVVDRPAPAGG